MADYEQITLATKSSAKLAIRFEAARHASPNSTQTIVVFLNGLGLPQESWNAVIGDLKSQREDVNTLTYDRYGQGRTTDRDPADEGAKDLMHGHDCMEVVRDLNQLIHQVCKDKLPADGKQEISIVLVANSIGCAIARLYAQEYPGTVAGLLLLDSVLANSDFVSIFPDPDAKDFDAATLPAGITPDALRQSREVCLRIFHPKNGSREGLSRKNLQDLLPASDGPRLIGPGSHGPYVTVVGHDLHTFANESAKMGTSVECSMVYTNPYWEVYNQSLVKITDPDRRKGPLQALNSGHFVQKDNPKFVAAELVELLSKLK